MIEKRKLLPIMMIAVMVTALIIGAYMMLSYNPNTRTIKYGGYEIIYTANNGFCHISILKNHTSIYNYSPAAIQVQKINATYANMINATAPSQQCK